MTDASASSPILRPTPPLHEETRERLARVLLAVRTIDSTPADISRYLSGGEGFPERIEQLMASPEHRAEMLAIADEVLSDLRMT